ncbi:hypothetical protein M0804_009767 [Polistes exclamans]|nr:hypothetical protein M0804_009767 [Polistes exclamans]
MPDEPISIDGNNNSKLSQVLKKRAWALRAVNREVEVSRGTGDDDDEDDDNTKWKRASKPEVVHREWELP